MPHSCGKEHCNPCPDCADLIEAAALDHETAMQHTTAVLEALPMIPPVDAMCHRGICSQEQCGHCTRVIRAHNALQSLLRGVVEK